MALNTTFIQGYTPEGVPQECHVDGYTHALHQTGTMHYRVHAGQAFEYSGKFTLGTGASLYLLGKVGQYNAHFRHFYVGSTAGPLDVELFRSPTVTVNGTQQSVFNLNEDSDNTSILDVYTGSTITVDGTRINIFGVLADDSLLFSATTADKINPEERILKKNTDYAIKMTNNDTVTATIYANFIWYDQVPLSV